MCIRDSLDEGKGGGIPGGVAPGLKGGPQTAGGEGRSVRFALDQAFSRKLQDDPAVVGGGEEGVVFARGDIGHRLEPVGEMGGAFFHGPLLHGLSDLIGGGEVQGLSLIHI